MILLTAVEAKSLDNKAKEKIKKYSLIINASKAYAISADIPLRHQADA